MIQLYTGEGKGKTTAAVGLAARAAGAGLKVLFVQFVKDGKSSEISSLRKLGVTVKAYGSGLRIDPQKENKNEKEKINEGINWICGNFKNYDVVIIDEAISAIDLELADEKSLICLAESMAEDHEVVLTGHNASELMIKAADLVTEMQPVKHYYEQGVKARKGIEY